MKKNFAEATSTRLNRLLVQDKLSSPERLSEVLKNEIAEVMTAYMKLDGIKLSVRVGETGKYEIYVVAVASRIFAPINI